MSLNGTIWSRVGTLFDEIAELPPDQRRDRLSRIETAEVREWVERLLEAHDAPGEAFVDQALDEIVEHMLEEQSDAFQLMPEDLTGKDFGNWRAVREIGRGGMGVVMRGERADGQFEKQVAIKLLPPGPVGPQRRDRFLAEIRALARLEHPNIAHLIDGGISDDGIPYLVMEFVEGMRIDHWCRQQQASLQQRLRLLLKVASAVSYAHGKLVVHADIQPANVLVNTQGEPKLVDFGIAGLLRPQHDERPNAADVLLHCSPAYAAPEQLRGERLTTACDVFGLGALMYELLTGQRIRDGREVTANLLGRQRVEDHISPPSQIQSGVVPVSALRGDLDAICCKALTTAPDQRYANVREFSDDIARHLAHFPVSARGRGRLQAFCRWVRRNRIAVAAGGLAALFLTAGLVSTSYYAIRVTREAQETARQRDRAQAVSDFLVRIFSASDPRENLGREPAAGELLDQGVRSIERDRSLDPETRARLTRLMGGLYQQLARYDESKRLLDAALEQFSRLLPAGDPEIGGVMLDMGERDYYAGALDQAAQRVNQALAILRTPPNGDQAQIARALHLQGLILQETGDYAAAERTLLEALQLRTGVYGDRHESVAHTLERLGYVLEKKRDYVAAEQRYQAALAMARDMLPDNDPFTATLLNDLGRIYGYQGRYVEALATHRRALAINTALYGARHPQTAINQHNTGFALHGLNRFDEAAASLDAALESYREELGAEHWLTARAESLRAELHADMGRFGDAEKLLDHALEASVKTYGEHHRDIAIIVLSQGYLRLRQGRYADAESIIRRAARISEACCASLGRLTARINARLAVSLAAQGQWDRAGALIRRYCASSRPVAPQSLTARTPACVYARSRLAEWAPSAQAVANSSS